MTANLVGLEDLEGSNSPPGRESRKDWGWSGGEAESAKNNGRPSLSDRLGERKERSRSRSPLGKDAKEKGSYSPTRELRYSREGTNTTSREPHLERARLFVGNIEPNRTNRRDLIKLFSNHGEVLGVSVHKGYAFVQMDREKSANKAINSEDNQIFMGSKMLEDLSSRLRSPPPLPRERDFRPPLYRDREPPYKDREPPYKDRELSYRDREPPYRERELPYRDRELSYRDREPLFRDREPRPHISEFYHLEEQEKAREDRLGRILHMEREISMLRSQQEGGVSRRQDVNRDHRSPPPSLNSHGYDSYSRDRDPPYRGSNGDRGRGYYGRQSPPEPSRGPSGDGYREPVSYPSQFTTGRGGGSRSIAPVGYGGGGSGKSSVTPPGWPSGGSDKSSAPNRPPFANTGPWS